MCRCYSKPTPYSAPHTIALKHTGPNFTALICTDLHSNGTLGEGYPEETVLFL